MRGIMGGFYRISEWIMRLSAINLLWVFCSFPVFFILLTMMVTEVTTADQVKSLLWTMAVLSPFTLIPASAAMFGVARKWVMGDTDVPLFKTYFANYKQNYKQSMLGGLLFLLIGFLIVNSILFYSGSSGAMSWISMLFISFSVVYAAAFLNFLCLTVHFHMKLKDLIKNSFIMTLGQPVTSIGMLLTNGVLLYMSGRFTFLIPFFIGSICATVTFWFFHRSLQRMQDKVDKAREKREALEQDEENAEIDGSTKS